MLDYIYQGEAQVHQEYLDRFLEIATKFKLSGLLTTHAGGEEEAEETLHETTENKYLYPGDNKKNEPWIVEERSNRSINQIPVESVDEVEKKFVELIEKEEDGLYRCTVCEKKNKHRTGMKRHLETHLSGLSYDCSQCGNSFRSSSALRSHHNHNRCSFDKINF